MQKIIPKKSLGQNFLRDEKVLEKIIASANLQADDFVIEVGPGEGVLTEKLSQKVEKVLAIEIDRNLIPTLEKKFAGNEKVEIINEDILQINFPDLFARYKIQDTRYKVVANIPYYITSKIIRLFLENENPPSEMILMVQKEVAKRIVEKPGKMSLLSVSVQYYAKAEMLFEVPRNCFFPVPEVDSAIIRITPNPTSQTPSQPSPSKEEGARKKFFRIVKAGFSAKRKTLVNNLSNSLHLEKNAVEEKLKTANLNLTARAQELSIDNWKTLSKLFNT